MDRAKTFFLSHWRTFLLYCLLALAISLPRALEPDKFVTVDEPQWLWRSANFYHSLAQKEFDQTSGAIGGGKNLTPGVVTMWVETFAFLLEYPEYRGLGQERLADPSHIEKVLVSKGVDPLEILVTARQIFTVWNTAILLLAFSVARRLFGLWPSLLGFILIAFEPYHIALTKIAHLDGPLSGVMLLSVLAFVAYAYDGRRMLFLVISAIAGGLAILTKLPGVLLAPFVGLVALVLIFERWRKQTAEQKIEFWSWFRHLAGHIILWGGIALITMAVLWPEMWSDPITILYNSFIRGAIYHTRETQTLIVGGAAAVAEKTALGFNIEFVLRYIISYLWHTTPIILFGLLAALIGYIRKGGLFAEEKLRRMIIALLVFVLAYFVPITIASTTSNRYIIPIYLPLNLIAALGWLEMAAWLKAKLNPPIGRYVTPVLLVGVVITQLFLAVRSHPYYFTYFNPLLGGSQSAGRVFDSGIGLGEGLDQAARYLNQKPDSENLRVKSWYYSGPFSYFFSGVARGISETNEWPPERVAEIEKQDYLVIYINQWKRRIPARLIDALDSVQPEHVIWIHQIEYVRIYKVTDLPPEFYELLLQEEGL